MSAQPNLEAAAQPAGRTPTPTGTITFLFSDIEGSTRLLQRLGDEYAGVLADHDRLMEGAIASRGGRVFGHEGDAVFAAFGEAGSAIEAAVDAQRALATHPWPHGEPLRVRIGINTGEAIASGSGYVGLPLHEVARICAAAHGGQVLVSETTRALVAATIPSGVELRDRGEHHLKDLARPEHLYELVADGLPANPAPLRTSSRRPNNLPLELTSFVGRAEIDAARRLFDETRLLTLTGPGGTGKTRLALQLARELMEEFPDGTWFVPLDTVDDADLVPSMIVHTLQLEVGREPPIERLVRELADKRVLLVLDNFEQVIGATPAVSRLLRDAPGVKLIVTSRIVLRAYGEQEFSVPPLAKDEAVRLFVERAKSSTPSFGLNDGNVEAVTDIVDRLDRLPLAIELAAARVRLLPVEALRARLDQRLTMLTGGSRDLPERQQTLRSAIDWSYDLLEEPDRRLFERLSVFAGGAGLTQIEEVCGPASEIGGDVLDGVGSLVEKSLLRSVPGNGVEPRFAMLATIREYATERLQRRGDADATRQRHVRAYLAMVDSCAPNLTGASARSYLELLELEHDNLRAAIDWSIATGDAETAHRFGADLWRFWQRRGHLHEAVDRIERILQIPQADALPPALRARTLGAAGSIGYWAGNLEATGRYYRLALEAAKESGDGRLIADATYNAGFVPDMSGIRRQRYAAGQPQFREAIELYRDLDDELGVANATWALGISLLAAGNARDGREHLESSLPLYGRLGNRFGEGWAHHMIGLIDAIEGKFDDAERRFVESARIFRETQDPSANVLLLLDFALVAKGRGDLERFWLLAGASQALSDKTGLGISGSIEDFVDLEAPVRPVGDPDAERAWDAGAGLDSDEALDLALGQARPEVRDLPRS